MTHELIISLTAVGTAGFIGLAWILAITGDVYRRGLRTGIDKGNASGYREGYVAGQRDGYHQAEREAADNLDGQLDQALRIANADQLAQLGREAGWQLTDTDNEQIEQIAKAKEDE